MLNLWPNDSAIQNDEAYTRLLLSPNDSSNNDELIAIEHLAEQLVRREPASLPHRTLLALVRLKQHRPVAALQVYDGINVAPNALTPSALAVTPPSSMATINARRRSRKSGRRLSTGSCPKNNPAPRIARIRANQDALSRRGYGMRVERVVKKSRSFREADRWDMRQNLALTPEQRIQIAHALPSAPIQASTRMFANAIAHNKRRSLFRRHSRLHSTLSRRRVHYLIVGVKPSFFTVIPASLATLFFFMKTSRGIFAGLQDFGTVRSPA